MRNILLCLFLVSLTSAFENEEFERGMKIGMFAEDGTLDDYSCEDSLNSNRILSSLMSVMEASFNGNVKRVKNKSFF